MLNKEEGGKGEAGLKRATQTVLASQFLPSNPLLKLNNFM